jgi:hypothetical protein
MTNKRIRKKQQQRTWQTMRINLRNDLDLWKRASPLDSRWETLAEPVIIRPAIWHMVPAGSFTIVFGKEQSND